MLLAATEVGAREKGWQRFLEVYSELLLRGARGSGAGGTYDGAMDRYAFVLDELRRSDFRRLRQFRETGGARFSTWLVVVTRRLCQDYERRKYGRRCRAGGLRQLQTRAARRRLADLVADCVEVADLPDQRPSDPESVLAARERRRVLDVVLTRLDSRSLLLLKLRFREELTAREIGELMGFPSQFHVFRRLTTVLERVREGLVAAGVDGPEL